MRFSSRSERGAILVLALLVSAVLAVMTGSIMLVAKQHINTSHEIVSGYQATLMNESCTDMAIAELREADSDMKNVDKGPSSQTFSKAMDESLSELSVNHPNARCSATVTEAAGLKFGSDVSSGGYGNQMLSGKIVQYRSVSETLNLDVDTALKTDLEVRR